MVEDNSTLHTMAEALHNLIQVCESLYIKPEKSKALIEAKAILARYDDENSVDGG